MNSPRDISNPRSANIALVTHGFPDLGGITTMTLFLHAVLTTQSRLQPFIINLPMSPHDPHSTGFLTGRYPPRRPQIVSCRFNTTPYTHIGAFFPELEPQRYRPRSILTGYLQHFDLIQVISGSPALAHATKDLLLPTAIWSASTIQADRQSRLSDPLTPYLRRFSYRVTAPALQRIQHQAIARADTLLALSEYTARMFRAIAPSRTVLLAPCGIDTAYWRPPSSGPPPNPSPYILCVGRLDDPRKNTRLLMHAYAEASHIRPSLPRLKLVGVDRPAALTTLAHHLGINDQVDLIPPLSPSHLLPLYQGADFFVLASDEEGLGIVILEAMGCALPVISTRCGGPQTAVRSGETGILINRRSLPELRDAILELSSSPTKRRRFGKAARQHATSAFSLEAAAQPFLQEYDRLLPPQPFRN